MSQRIYLFFDALLFISTMDDWFYSIICYLLLFLNLKLIFEVVIEIGSNFRWFFIGNFPNTFFFCPKISTV